MFNCPHTGVALAALIKLLEGRQDRQVRARRRHLHRPRPQVHGFQGPATTRATLDFPCRLCQQTDRAAAHAWMRVKKALDQALQKRRNNDA
ncbi:MAG: hypothetical protein MZU97_08920 [Bacillus subtilis]|nr:hypothetical protein [Bacillus subtilis]